MFHKVQSVKPLPDFVLQVWFQDGCCRLYDLKPLFTRWAMFQPLRDIHGLYESVSVDAGGYGVSWNDDIDLSCDELWSGSVVAQ